jgi:hypothetical protein
MIVITSLHNCLRVRQCSLMLYVLRLLTTLLVALVRLHGRATITFLYIIAVTNFKLNHVFLLSLELALTPPTRQLAQS